jgi:hypothetical protein
LCANTIISSAVMIVGMFAKGLSLRNSIRLHEDKMGQFANVLKRPDVTNTG